MGINFTPEQQKVIELRGCNILVSAAAGSGKTAVLSERIVRMVCDDKKPIDIDRLLIVTFTKAAAAEMRERIHLGILDQLDANPDNEHIQKQTTLIHNALITTIDSFCLYLIRNHFHEIGLDPAFRVADEGEIKLLRQEVLQELLEEKFTKKTEEESIQKYKDFLDCVEYFCPNGKETVLEQHILNLYEYAGSFPWPEEWLLDRKNDYHMENVKELEQKDFVLYFKKYLNSMIQGCIIDLKRSNQICEESDGPYMYGELLEKEIEQLEKMLGICSLGEYEYKFSAIEFERLPSKKDDSVNPEKREEVKNLRNNVKETIKEIKERFFKFSLLSEINQSKTCEKAVVELIDLTLSYGELFRKKKDEKKILDFPDIEHYALKILVEHDENGSRPTRVAEEYKQNFYEILIDEYQDSNLVQEYLLTAVAGESNGKYNRFMVGDVKQSIYKFRLARPELFLDKYIAYTSAEGNEIRIDLSKNFRSRDSVIQTVNKIFSNIMSKEIGGIAYDNSAALHIGATYPENKESYSELLLIEKPNQESEISAKQLEAKMIADRIKHLMQEQQVVEKGSGELRPLQYRDIVILLRTNSGWDEEFKKGLEEEGIPSYITSKTGYFAASEVQCLLQLLRVLDNPRQDIPLYGVMKSIFGGFTEEEIAILKSNYSNKNNNNSLFEILLYWKNKVSEESLPSNGHLHHTMEETASSKETWLIEETRNRKETGNIELRPEFKSLQKKVILFLAFIDNYRERIVYMPIRELLQMIVREFDYLSYVTALPSGGKRRANVEMLFTKASDFEKTSYYGLFHFVRYMEQLEKYDVDYGEADMLDENADVVRIMSIHKSKGLEFPVTFVSGLSKKFNMQDTNKSVVLDVDLGIGVDYLDISNRVKYKTFRRHVLAQKLKEDNLSEELRVLYVALTRAKEKLIMTATLDEAALENFQKQMAQKANALSYKEFVKAGSYLDFLLPVIGETDTKLNVYSQTDLETEHRMEQVKFSEKKQKLHRARAIANEDLQKKIMDRFRFTYAHQNLQNLHTKTTVSELKMAAMEEKDEVAYQLFEDPDTEQYVPEFRKEKEKNGGTQRGNAYHKAMELLDFDKVFEGIFSNFPTKEDYRAVWKVESNIRLANEFEGMQMHADVNKTKKIEENLTLFFNEMVACQKLSEEYREYIEIEKVMCFLADNIAFRMWKAQKNGTLYREQPFVYGMNAKRLSEEFPEGEKVLIQGIIDVYFIEDGKVVVLDYKTDRVKTGEELWNRYEAQLSYYEEALSRLTELEVKEKVIYSFLFGRCV